SEGSVPVLAAHGDNPEVGKGGAGVGVGDENLAESFFRGVEISGLQCGLTLLKKGLSISNACRLFGLRGGKRRGQKKQGDDDGGERAEVRRPGHAQLVCDSVGGRFKRE